MAPADSREPLKVYWQPGCSSCLRVKEFLLAHGVRFNSINVLRDKRGFRELEALGIRSVPVVSRGKDWANGAVLRDVARVAGVEWRQHEMLLPESLVERIDGILSAARRFLDQVAEEQLDTMLPGRPRSYRDLAYHIFRIVEVFLNRVEHDALYAYEAIQSKPPPNLESKDELIRYTEGLQARFMAWWQRAGPNTDFAQPGKVYFGEATLHEVFERTAWHSGQHTRQFQLALEKLGITADGPVTDTDFAGLPMPDNVWDNEASWD